MAPTCDVSENIPRPALVAGESLGLQVNVTMPGFEQVFRGVMEHFVCGEASILLDHIFAKGTPVQVEFHGFQFDAEVLYCERKGEQFDTHVVIPDLDKLGMRRDPRYVVNLPARVYTSHIAEPFEAKLIDISKNGIGLESESALELDQIVAVESQSNLAFGIVRHCVQLSSGAYRAGLYVYNTVAKDETPVTREEKRHRVFSFFRLGPQMAG